MTEEEIATTLDAMTKDERGLLLYLEARAVDHGGKVEGSKMNAEDFEMAKAWSALSLIGFSRLLSAHVRGGSTHAVQLSDNAFALAGEERKRRAYRTLHDEVVESLDHHGEVSRAG